MELAGRATPSQLNVAVEPQLDPRGISFLINLRLPKFAEYKKFGLAGQLDS